MNPQQYCLRWKHHHTNVQNMFAQLLEKERFCDVTLYCSPNFSTQVSGKDTVEPHNIRGVSLRAHRVVLAACSELLGALLGAHEAQGEPVLVIDGAEPKHVKALLDYMYTGEMNVHHSQLASLLKTAEELRIKGLTNMRWNNKDEPPDYDTGIVTTATSTDSKPQEKHNFEAKPPKQLSPKHSSPKHSPEMPEQKPKEDEHKTGERFNINGGPPPLIKLPVREKSSPVKRENSDSDSPSPKRPRQESRSEQADDDPLSIPKLERDQEWQHGNLDITAERVVGWGETSVSRDASDDEWADAPADIGSFLHTNLRVDGDNSADEESNESVRAAPLSSSSSASAAASELRVELAKAQMSLTKIPLTIGPKSGPTDPRFTDVVKLSDYLQHGRRPQFWEENYVKRVMEAVRLKELEMKQAAEILGVSYGTLYGRYRDVYGCINRPYSTSLCGRDRAPPSLPSQRPEPVARVSNKAVRDFWQAKGPSEVLERLQRGEVTLDAAAQALGVSMANLSAHVADFGIPDKDFEQQIPIEMDPSLKMRPRTFSGGQSAAKQTRKSATIPTNTNDKPAKKVLVGSVTDEEPIPATLITTYEAKPQAAVTAAPTSTVPEVLAGGKWPSIRVASIDTLRGTDPPAASPSTATALMRNRPDLTIVAARKSTPDDEEHT